MTKLKNSSKDTTFSASSKNKRRLFLLTAQAILNKAKENDYLYLPLDNNFLVVVKIEKELLSLGSSQVKKSLYYFIKRWDRQGVGVRECDDVELCLLNNLHWSLAPTHIVANPKKYKKTKTKQMIFKHLTLCVSYIN